MKEVSRRWSEMSAEEKAHFQLLADNTPRATLETFTDADKKSFIAAQVKSIKKSVSQYSYF